MITPSQSPTLYCPACFAWQPARAASDASVPPDTRDFPEDSRILLLGTVLNRRLPHYGLAAGTEAERRVILAVAADTLPDAYPPSEREAELARLVKQALAYHKSGRPH